MRLEFAVMRMTSARFTLVATLVAALGCREPEPIRLVPIAGCGLDQTFSGLRLQVVGDFPPTSSSELLLGPGESSEFTRLVAGAQAITAEGVFGVTITAIGRSYGIDPELAQGRVPGEAGPLLAMWFAAPDSMCAVPATIAPRSGFAWALSERGDVLIVGGRDATGSRADVIHYDALANVTHAHADEPSAARVGHSVHAIGPDRFLVLGGAIEGGTLADSVVLQLVDESLVVEPRDSLGVAHHAAATGSGSIVVAGGCAMVDALGECSGEVSAAAWLVASEGEAMLGLPPLQHARADATMLVSADGLVYVAGGHDGAGVELGSVERLAGLASGGQGEWASEAEWAIEAEFEVEAIVGFTVLEGGLILAADRDGDLHWSSAGGSGVLEPGFRAPTLAPALGERILLSLPGERVVVDGWIFAPGSAALDPSAEIVDLTSGSGTGGDSTPARTGGEALLLGDGSVLLGGGTAISPGELPFLARVRPQLDGPDEQVPELASPRSDAFVTNTPGAVAVFVGGLRLTGVAGPADALPAVRAHVRGFRSRSARLEFELGGEVGNTGVILVGQGVARVLALELAPGGVRARLHADDDTQLLDCAGQAFASETPAVLELGEDALRVRLLQGDRVVADCSLHELAPWSDPGGLHVGFGVAGPGDRSFRALRLARL